MKVTFLADKLNVNKGGSNHSLNLTAELLARRGHDVTVVTFNFVHDNDPPKDTAYELVEDPVGRGGKVEKATRIFRRLDRYDADTDLLHVFNPAILPIAGYHHTRRGKSPIVGRLNTYDIFCSNLSRMTPTCFESCTIAAKFRHDDGMTIDKVPKLPEYVFNTYALPTLIDRVDRLLALSPAVKHIYESIGVAPESIDVVPNFVDPGFGERHARADLFDPDSWSVVYVGRLEKAKGVDLLIQALEYLDRPDEYRLEIVGGGQDEAEIKALAEGSPHADRIRFHGWVPYGDLPSYYESADAFVHPSRWPEPFGRTILEAMQFDCRPIVSDVGGPPWIVGDSGYVFDWDDPEALADTVSRARQEGIKKSVIAERLTAFDPERIVTRLEETYQSLL